MALRQRVAIDRLRLFDANPAMLPVAARHGAQEQVTIVDILKDDIPHMSSDIVVADPPWYPDCLAGFLWAGSLLLRPGGTMFLSAPPVGTRPGVLCEREGLFHLASHMGLTFCSTRAAIVGYSSPPFERAALRAASIGDYVPGDWRQGDLLEFRRTGSVVGPRPISGGRRWAERVIRGIRIQIDDLAPETARDPRLVSVVSGDVLPSVSRRDKRRSSVRVWTSGNRVFGCAAPARLVEIIDNLLAGKGAEHPNDREATSSILELVDRERSEYMYCNDRGDLV